MIHTVSTNFCSWKLCIYYWINEVQFLAGQKFRNFIILEDKTIRNSSNIQLVMSRVRNFIMYRAIAAMYHQIHQILIQWTRGLIGSSQFKTYLEDTITTSSLSTQQHELMRTRPTFLDIYAKYTNCIVHPYNIWLAANYC